MDKPNMINLDYHNALSPLGGSYVRNKLKKLFLPDLNGLRFLDLGCNSGFYCKYAADQGAAKVVGVDIDKNIIDVAREICPSGIFYSDGWSKLPDGLFDVVIILSAIHYANDPCELIDKVYELMSEDGLLVIEGGIIDPKGKSDLDILVPGWRLVGDRCRHLTFGYLKNHCLTSFQFEIIGESEPRGGDDVKRYVVHARKGKVELKKSTHTVDLLEYFRGLIQSSHTVSEIQPAYQYIKNLQIDFTNFSCELDFFLANKHLFELFMTDLFFSLGSTTKPILILSNNISDHAFNKIKVQIESAGYTVLQSK